MNKYINNNIEKIFIIFLIMQPIIDVLTAIMLNIFNIDFTIGIIIRFIFMLFMIYYLFFVNKNNDKKKSIIYILFILFYFILYGISMFCINDNNQFLFEIKNMVKSFYFPIILVSLLELYKSKKNSIDIKLFRNIFILYCLFILIPNVLNVGFDAYEVTKKGNIGLFYTANEVGAIISILMPLFICDILSKKNIYLDIVVSVILLYLLTSIGTKGPLISLVIIVFVYLMKYLKECIKEKKYKPIVFSIITFIIIVSLSLLVMPKTTFYKNIKTHLDFLKVDEVSDLTKPKIFDHFIFSSRLKFWNKTNKDYINSNLQSKLLGIGYKKSNMKMVEMDYVDIFYRHGIVGFIIYFSSLIYILYLVIWKNKGIKAKDNRYYSYLLSIFLALILALFTGHVLTSPSVSIFVALIINLFYNNFSKGDSYG